MANARKSKAVATAERKAREFLRRVKDDVKDRKVVDRLDILAREQYDAGEYVARLGLAGKAQAVLNRVAVALREGRLNANETDRARLRAIAGEGLEDWRADLWLQNNVRSAYNAGRSEQQQRDRTRPYLRYHTMRDHRVRDGHRKLEGIVLPKSDKFWTTHYPPNGHNCRCRVDALTRAEFEALIESGERIKTKAPRERRVSYIDRITGEKTTTPESVDPGWEGNPAADPSRLARLLERAISRIEKTPLDGTH